MPSAARTFPYRGAAEPRSSITIYRDNGVLCCTTKADDNGNYAGDIGGLPEGSYSFYAVARKTPKHESKKSDPVSVVVTPNAPVITGPPDGSVAADAVTLYVTMEPGYLNVFDNGVLVQGPTQEMGGIGVALAPILLPSGVHSMTATVTGFNGGGASELSNAVGITVSIPLPTVVEFTIPATTAVLTVPVLSLVATTHTGAAGFLITTSATPPLVTDPGWTAWSPTSYLLPADGSYTLYAWVKDHFGQVSAVYPGQPVRKLTMGAPMDAVKADLPTSLYEMDEGSIVGSMVDTEGVVNGTYIEAGLIVAGQYPPSLANTLDGIGPLASIGAPGGLAAVTSSQPFSIEFVVYGNPTGAGGGFSFLMADTSNQNQNNGFKWQCNNTQHYVTIQYDQFQNDQVWWYNDFNASGWNHCVMTRDGLGSYRVFVNGVEKTVNIGLHITPGLPLIHGGSLYLGATSNSQGPVKAGVLWDYLAFWIGTELTPQQALEHYQGRLA